MDAQAAKLIGAGIAMIGALGAGVGLGNIFGSWLQGIARNPSASKEMFVTGMIGFAVTEFVMIMCFVVSFMLMNK